jgi:PcfJ-like protein
MERSQLQRDLRSRSLRETQIKELLKSRKEKDSFHKPSLIEALYGDEATVYGHYATLRGLVQAHRLLPYERTRLLSFLKRLDDKKTDLLGGETELVQGVVMVSRYLPEAIRRIVDWKPQSHNRFRTFSDMVRFLFARYPVPLFMDSAFFDTDSLFAQWFIHLAQGGSVRKLPYCPINMTTKMAHHFMQAPPQYSVKEALRYGQILALGGNERLVKAVLASRLGQHFDQSDFWETVIRFFIQNPMLDLCHVQPIVDYVQNIKFESLMVINPNNLNEWIEAPPEQPHFSMKGRTAFALLRLVDAWHKSLAQTHTKLGKVEVKVWKPVAISNFYHVEGTSDDNRKFYTIEQLLTSPALIAEGRKMLHCVYSYLNACVSGRTSIWTMTFSENPAEKNKVLTLEVTNQIKEVVQVRGKCNRLPTALELKVVERWAAKEGLKISKWVVHS